MLKVKSIINRADQINDDELEQMLNDGWELYNCYVFGDDVRYIFVMDESDYNDAYICEAYSMSNLN